MRKLTFIPCPSSPSKAAPVSETQPPSLFRRTHPVALPPSWSPSFHRLPTAGEIVIQLMVRQKFFFQVNNKVTVFTNAENRVFVSSIFPCLSKLRLNHHSATARAKCELQLKWQVHKLRSPLRVSPCAFALSFHQSGRGYAHTCARTHTLSHTHAKARRLLT